MKNVRLLSALLIAATTLVGCAGEETEEIEGAVVDGALMCFRTSSEGEREAVGCPEDGNHVRYVEMYSLMGCNDPLNPCLYPPFQPSDGEPTPSKP